jgi:hypothetical protein
MDQCVDRILRNGQYNSDLGSDVNVIPRQTWEMMAQAETDLVSYPVDITNQHKIVPVGRLTRVSVNIDGVHSVADFEVIEIVDGSTPYPTLLGLDWEFDNQTIIDLKKRHMVFEVEDLKVTMPLDPLKEEGM